MLDLRFRKVGLGAFDYKRTPWFQTILSEARDYKKTLLYFVFPAVAAIPPLLEAVISLVYGHAFPLYCLAPLLVSLIQVAAIRLIGKVEFFSWLSMAFLAVAFVLSAYVDRGLSVVALVMVFLPVFCLQLHGSRRGSFFYGGLSLAFVLTWGFASLGLLPPWKTYLGPVSFVALAVGSALLYFFSLFAERRQENLVGKLTDLMVFSPSTGLPNREVLTFSLDPTLHYVFAIIKIENFSDLVALFGYEFSDTISQFASQQLSKHEIRYGYRTYQLKYNEYGVLILRDGPTSTVNAIQLLDEIVRALDLEALPWEQDRIRLVYRVGGTSISPGDTRSPLSMADIALKRAEHSQSVITVFTDDTHERETSYNYVMRFSDLVTNRENGTFRAVFQPIYKADGSGISWYEALLRIKKPDGTFSSIYPYLEVARSTGFYHYLTEFILRKSAEAILEFDINVSVNISIADIVRSDFIALVEEIHHMIRDRAGRIIFEILESDELVELDKCVWFIDYVSRFGFRIAIDDFGSGYSNYINLLNLPIDIVKIDGSLIRRIRSDENAKTLVEGIVHFCKKTNKQTVAEFVEDDEVYDSLQNLNIDYFQGYYFSRPKPLSGPSEVGDA